MAFYGYDRPHFNFILLFYALILFCNFAGYFICIQRTTIHKIALKHLDITGVISKALFYASGFASLYFHFKVNKTLRKPTTGLDNMSR